MIARTYVRVAYLVNQYPKVSHSFIRREILALEAAGVLVSRYAVRGWAESVADPADEQERARTTYLLQGGLTPLLASVLRLVLLAPGRLLNALMLASRLSSGGDRSLLVHLVYLAEAALLVRLMRAEGVQHLHCHFGTNPAAVGLLARVLGGPTYSFTVHGPEEFDKPMHLKLTEKARLAAFVVAISSFGRSQLFRWLDSHDWCKVHVIRCGVDPSFHDAEGAFSGAVSAASSTSGFEPASGLAKVPLVCVGRLCEQKGQLLLVEAVAELRRRGIQLKLVLAGDGEMRSQIEARAKDLGVGDAVRITGWISGAQVRDEMISARALVLPSFAEGLPVVLMEAMSLRRPVISTYVAGIPELVKPGVNGWLAVAGDVESLVRALEDCLSTPAERLLAMGDAGHALVLDRHDIHKETSRLKHLFEATVAQTEGDS